MSQHSSRSPHKDQIQLKKVFITNLDGQKSEDVLEEDLRKLFGEHGVIVKLNVKKNKNGQYSFGFLEFGKAEEANSAIKALDQFQLYGKNMRVYHNLKYSRQDRQSQGCFNCKKSGHFARQCPQRRQQSRYDRKRNSHSRSRDKYERSRRQGGRYRQRENSRERIRERQRQRQREHGGRDYERYDRRDHYRRRESRSRSSQHRRYRRRNSHSRSSSNRRGKSFSKIDHRRAEPYETSRHRRRSSSGSYSRSRSSR